MRRLSRIYIEAIAKRFIQAYMELPEIKTSQIYRIDPEIFLEKILKLDIRYLHLSYDCSLLGLTAFEQIEVNVLTGADEEEKEVDTGIRDLCKERNYLLPNTNCRRRRKAGFSLCKNPGGTIRKGSGSRAFDSRSVVQERKPNSQ